MTDSRGQTQSAVRLLEKASQLRARADVAESRAKLAGRKIRTRKAILLGTWIMKRYGEDLARLTPDARKDLDAFLTRQHDREVFGMAAQP